jgi:dihydroxyacetone kinase-like protein
VPPLQTKIRFFVRSSLFVEVLMSQDITLAQLRDWLLRYADLIDDRAAYLTELDAAIGDADHGANMVRGMSKVRSRLLEDVGGCADIGALLRTVAMTLISSIGGASGPLYGAFFMRAAKESNGNASVSLGELTRMFRCGVEGVQQRGKANLEEKTMLDALEPAVDAMEQAVIRGQSPEHALTAASVAAQEGHETHNCSGGQQGPRQLYSDRAQSATKTQGATSSYYLFATLADAVGKTSK